VFSDTRATTVSAYFRDIIRTNLAKNNVVIQVVCGEAKEASLSIHPNLLVKHRANPSAPLFFPRVDECYYSGYKGDTVLNTMRCVMNIIDLWNIHNEMILYVIKDRGDGDESGTEGFDSDESDTDTYIKTPAYIDYAKIFEEYFRLELSVIPNQKRGLVVLF
jgi:hypothetical protein